MADPPLPGVGRDRRGGVVPRRLGRAGRARAGRLHVHRGPPLHRAPRRRRPVVGGDRRGPGGGAAVPPDPRLDDGVGEGRRAAARLGGAGRRHGARRLRAARRGVPRPVARVDAAGRARAVLTVQRHARADDGDRRAGRAARRPAAHPPRRGPRRGRVLPRALRPPSRRPVRRGGVADLAGLGGALPLPGRPRDHAARRRRRRRRALPELEHDPGQRPDLPGAATCARRGRRSGWAATARRATTSPRCGWRRAPRCCSARCAAARRR